MSDNDTTDGLPSSDLFNLTAPNNEYLTDVQSTTSTEVEFIPFDTYSPIKQLTQYKILDLLSKFKQIKDFYEANFEKSKEYLEYINSEDIILRFSEILEDYLTYYFKLSYNKPIKCEFMMFIFPGEDYEEPMIKITYSDSDEFNNLEIRDDIEEKFKRFLVKKSENLDKFKAFRQVQKKFRFVIQRE